MIAIISDIHGNLEALQAVLKDIESQGVKNIFCLGDIVGYGPNPCECLDLVEKNCSMTLLGNHDNGALFDPDGFNPSAEKAIFWTRAQLEKTGSQEDRERRHKFLSTRPRMHRQEEFLFVHGSARNPLNEYVFPEDIYNQRKMERIFAVVERYCFQGHTHVPGVFVQQEGSDFYNFAAPDELNFSYELDQKKTLCNVGSVGQPRDGNWRSCYIILKGSTIKYRRVEYEIDATVHKIYGVPDLENFLGDRLREGR
ncbi:MAG: metallophosphoesterase [Gemmataceae bacterium]|nr:metallophosphoesterase [Gemmataceae bacterium]